MEKKLFNVNVNKMDKKSEIINGFCCDENAKNLYF